MRLLVFCQLSFVSQTHMSPVVFLTVQSQEDPCSIPARKKIPVSQQFLYVLSQQGRTDKLATNLLPGNSILNAKRKQYPEHTRSVPGSGTRTARLGYCVRIVRCSRGTAGPSAEARLLLRRCGCSYWSVSKPPAPAPGYSAQACVTLGASRTEDLALGMGVAFL